MNEPKSGAQLGRAGLVCAMLLVASLTGCGGGGSSTPPPVGGNPPAPPPPPPPPPPAPPTVSIKLQGKVTDEPIPNAVVTATVAGEEFQTTANADGDYSLDIEIPEADAAGAFVTLNAHGVGDQAFVEFTSVVGSFTALSTAAGADGTLTASENFATQITNVSTAVAVLMQQANGGDAIVTDAALLQFAAQVNAQAVLDLATAIKLAVDDPENHPLPDGSSSILALASDATARATFIDTVFTQDPAAFAAAQSAIAADPRLAQDIVEATLIEAGALTTAMLSTDAGFSFNYSGRVVHFDLNADHTGSMVNDTHDVQMTWAVEGKELRVTYNSPIETVSYDTENCVGGGGVRQVEAHYVSEGMVVTYLSANQVAMTTVSDITYADCESLEAREETSTQARTVLSLEQFETMEESEFVGFAQTIYVWDADQETVVADVADLQDGTGTTRFTGKAFTWELQDDGKIAHLDFADGSVAEFLSFHDVDEVVSDIFWEVRAPNDGPVHMGAGASVAGEPEGSLELTPETLVGRYYQFGIGNETTPDARLKGFRLRLDADFMGAHEDDYLDDNDALVTRDETTQSFNGFRWEIDEGAIVIRRTWDTMQQEETCLYTDPNCVTYDIRTIVPLAQEGSRVYVIEQRQAAPGSIVDDSTPFTRLVRFYDFEAPAAGPGKLRAAKANGFKARSLVKGASNK